MFALSEHTIPEAWIWDTTEAYQVGFPYRCRSAWASLLELAGLEAARPGSRAWRAGLRPRGRGAKIRVQMATCDLGPAAIRLEDGERSGLLYRVGDGRVLWAPLPPSWQHKTGLPERVVLYVDAKTRQLLGCRTRGHIASRRHAQFGAVARSMLILCEAELPAWATSALSCGPTSHPFR